MSDPKDRPRSIRHFPIECPVRSHFIRKIHYTGLCNVSLLRLFHRLSAALDRTQRPTGLRLPVVFSGPGEQKYISQGNIVLIDNRDPVVTCRFCLPASQRNRTIILPAALRQIGMQYIDLFSIGHHSLHPNIYSGFITPSMTQPVDRRKFNRTNHRLLR